MNFSEFNLNESLVKGLEKAGYVTCTPVQEQVLKMSQDGSDLYVQSQTGTGKTAAYLVAIIQEMLSNENNKGKKALIMVPTRELAVQVEEEAKTLCSASELKAYSVYGGVGYEKQIAAIKKGLDIIVGTPGRLIDLQEGGNLSLSDVAFVVVDEADRMFDMGFYPDLRKIMKQIPANDARQTMLFSATLNTYVKNLAWEYTRDAKEIEIEAENITVSEIDQELLHVSSDEKMKLLLGILKSENPESVIIFCNTKRSCEVTAKRLSMNDIKAEFLIGDLPQSKRLQILKAFKAGDVKVLVATDVAARGIDVDDLAMVINFDLPNEAENYVHRIGRTARAGKSGKAYTFCSEQDVYSLPAIERYIEMSIPAKVAYPEQMVEDKSAGIYIKTENWHDDDELDKKGGRRSSTDRRYSSSSKARNERNNKASAYKSDKKDGYKGKKDSYKKDGHKKDFKKDYNKNRKYDKKDTAGMENLSFEERMKLYKEKYGSGNTSSKKSYGNKKHYNKGGYTNIKNNKYAKNRKTAAEKTVKKGLFARIKAFFGR